MVDQKIQCFLSEIDSFEQYFENWQQIDRDPNI